LTSENALKGRLILIQSITNYIHTPFFVGVFFLFAVVIAEFLKIMVMNNGFFVYTIDDPYIHLALGENIIHGHYGINFQEVSSPSSSILWPFLLAPFSSFEYFPFVLNILFSSITVYFYYRILDKSFKVDHPVCRLIIISTSMIFLILGSNIIGLIFTGMEHSLQVLMVAIIAWGLILDIEGDVVKPWILATIAIAPLIRYENTCIALGALGYLSIQKQTKKAVFTFIAMVLLLSGFSIFLTSLGVEPLPESVLAKSPVMPNRNVIDSITNNIKFSLLYPQGRFLILGSVCLWGYVFFNKSNTKKRNLAAITSIVIGMHLVAGRYGWYNRYEIYIWTFLLLVVIYLAGEEASRRITKDSSFTQVTNLATTIGIFIILTSLSYLVGIITLPTAANNIYEQQYQMHRFAVEYYQKPIAVNDLGYVSYKNNHYVLDLWGLISPQVFEHRVHDQSSTWMDNLAKSKDVEFAMIYEAEFNDIPDKWIKIGELHLGHSTISPLYGSVSFYALSENAKLDAIPKLEALVMTLPSGVEFIFEQGISSLDFFHKSHRSSSEL
jgi:hypothetical protein